MTQKLGLKRTAAVLALIASSAGLAVAQGEQKPTAVQKGTVAQPAAVEQAPVATVGPKGRPGKIGALGVQDSISVLLTEAECKGLGGTVNEVETSVCKSGKVCMTADKDGVIRGVCFKKE